MAPLLLLVDDAPEVIQIVRILARRSAQEILCLAGFDEILAWMRQSPGRLPDLLLIDLHLSGESGIDLYRRLVRAMPLASIPAALFTQGAPAHALAEALEVGIDFLVSKELLAQPEGWKERIDEVLQLAQAGPEALPSGNKLDARRLAGGVWRALLHPVLGRLEEEGLRALWRKALLRARPGDVLSESDVDVLKSSGTLAQYFARLGAHQPDLTRSLLLALGYQVECLLGRVASDPVRAALLSALNDAVSSTT
jgi:CheY-like chemotaxis protein